MKNIAQVISAVLISMSALSSHAITINYSDLPDQIQSDIAPIYIGISSLDSIVDTSYMNAFMINNGGQLNWLIRYNLDSASSKTTVYDGFDGVVTPYSGSVWLEAPVSLDMNGENFFKIYTDQILPNPDQLDVYPSNVNNQSTWIFGMYADAARSGGASVFLPYDEGIGLPVLPIGDLDVVDGFFTCVECVYNVSLNLVGLHYDTAGNGVINPGDQRALLLSYNDSDPVYSLSSTERNFYVQQPVPVPAAVWLFGSGLLSLLGFAKRRKH